VRWFRRKKFVINKKLQFRFLLIILCYVGVFVLVIFASLFAPLILQLRHADVTSIEASEAALRILYLHDKFRASDYLHPELNVINGMLEALRERIGQMQGDAEKLHETLSRYGELLKQAHQDTAAAGLWDEIIGREKQLRETLEDFKIER
jgi:hypothetical protein